MKYLSKIFLLLAVAFMLSCGNADLRTELIKNNEARGKQILADVAKAHGVENWEAIGTYEVIFEDLFYGMGNPYADDSVRLKLQYITNTFDGNLEFLNGDDKGKLWGVQAWKSYQKEAGKDIEFKNDSEVIFWVPTYQYFIEYPARIQNADKVSYAGEATINGVACIGVMATWGSFDPQNDIDQYLIWVDKQTNQIVKLEYTIREIYGFLKGAVSFQEYKSFEGILIPTKMPVESNMSSDILHEMRVIDFKPNTIAKTALLPDTSLPFLGTNKVD